MCYYGKSKSLTVRSEKGVVVLKQGRESGFITAQGIRKAFKTPDGKATTVAIDDVSLSVGPREFVAIVGSSGSGKSTLLYCLSGLEKIDSGSVSLLGAPFDYIGQTADLSKEQSQGIGFVFQSYQLLAFLTVTENILLPAKYAGKTAEALQRLPELLERLGLSEKADAKVNSLSGGQQQRVAIARALINEPSVVFADEPTGALDTKNAKEVIELLAAIPNEQRSVVMVTHDLEVAARASRVLVLSDGRIIQELGKSTAEQIFAAMNQTSSTKGARA